VAGPPRGFWGFCPGAVSLAACPLSGRSAVATSPLIDINDAAPRGVDEQPVALPQSDVRPYAMFAFSSSARVRARPYRPLRVRRHITLSA